MGGILDTEKFERFQIKDWFRQLKDNPGNSLMQFLLGGADPFGAALWGKILGRDFEPFVNQLGGPTDKRFKDARQAGIDTGLSEKSHRVASIIAAYQGAQGLGNVFGGEGALTEIPASEFAPTARLAGGTGGAGAASGNANAGNVLSNMFPDTGGGNATGGNSFLNQLQQQRPSLGGGQQQTGNTALDKVNLIRLMAELQRLQAQRAVEQQRRQFG